jgi:hypothetical protein
MEIEKFDIIVDCVGGDDYFFSMRDHLKNRGVYSTASGPIIGDFSMVIFS